MGCAGSKSEEIDKKLPAGRLEAEAPTAPAPAEEAAATPDKLYSREGLHSAPTRRSPACAADGSESTATDPAVAAVANEEVRSDSPGGKSRVGLHSAPPLKRIPSGAGTAKEAAVRAPSPEPFEPIQGLTEFIVEKSGSRTPAEVDAYLGDVLGLPTVRNLRSVQWAERVQGLEEVKARLEASRQGSTAEQLPVFKACVTVLSRLLQDRVVPVFLPALELLVALFHDAHMAALPSHLPRAAVAHTCDQMVLRCGSSNGRARDESIDAVLHCARSTTLGPQAVAQHVLKPLANSKSQQAAVGRLELLHRLVIKYGLSKASGLTVERVLAFGAPLCNAAGEKAREAAFAVIKEARVAEPAATDAVLSASYPSVLAALDPKAERPAEVSSKRRALPPIGARPPPSGFFDGASVDSVVVGGKRPLDGPTPTPAAAAPPRSFLAPPPKASQVAPSLPF